MIPAKVRGEVVERDNYCCRRCGVSVIGIRSSVHHRLPRRMGGTKDPRSNDPRNLVLLCGSGVEGCHGDVESDRAQAYEQGWLIRSYDELDKPMIEPNPCGHWPAIKGCGGCDPGAVEFVRDDGGPWRRVGGAA